MANRPRGYGLTAEIKNKVRLSHIQNFNSDWLVSVKLSEM